MLLESCFCYCCRMSMQVCAKILALCMFACVRVFRYLCLLIGTNTYTGRCCSCCCLWLWSFFILFCFGEWTLPAWHSETRLLYYAGQDGTTATCRSFFLFLTDLVIVITLLMPVWLTYELRWLAWRRTVSGKAVAGGRV